VPFSPAPLGANQGKLLPTAPPRFTKFTGVEAPPLHELPGVRRQRASLLPLHSKDVAATISLEALLGLPFEQREKTITRINQVFRWLTDEGRYQAIVDRFSMSAARTHRTILSDTDLDILLRLRKYEEVSADIQIPGQEYFYCNAFTVPELAKNRRRNILEPLINDWIHHGDFEDCILPSKEKVRQAMTKRYAIQFDFRSYFDQFALSEEVRRFFCLRRRRRTFRSKVLPMGFRPSCAIAQTTTDALLDFHMPEGVCSIGYIDNVAFTSDSIADLITVASTFLARCHTAGVQVNEIDGDPKDRVTITEAITQNLELLGEKYDTLNCTRCLTTKTLEKLIVVDAFLKTETQCSNREMAAVFGILLYSANVLDFSLCDVPNALKYFRRIGVSAYSHGWDSTAPIMEELQRREVHLLCAAALRNTPVTTFSPKITPTRQLFCDASDWGWGCIYRSEDGIVTTHAGPWSPIDRLTHNLQSSVSSEPLGLWRSMCAAVDPQFTGAIEIFTDHSPLVFAAAAGYSPCTTYNTLLRNLKDNFRSTCLFTWIPGAKNPADTYSRGNFTGPPTIQIGS